MSTTPPIFENGPKGSWRMERAHPMLTKPRSIYGGSRLRIYGAPIFNMTVNVEYPGFNLVARGGVKPYSFGTSGSEMFWADVSGNEIYWSDENGNQIVWYAGSLPLLPPPGIVVNAVTGMVFGTPTEIGVYPVRFQVVDAKGNFAQTDIIYLNVVA